MNTAVADGPVHDIQAEAHALTKQQTEQWFLWMDRMLDIHRNNFVFREPTPAQLAEHITGLKLAIRHSHIVNTLVADPDFNDADLVSRLQTRIRQLQDAYDTFHDATLSNEEAVAVLKQAFPE